jgi:hypothetical protein
MNVLIFTEDNTLKIQKPNGLRYEFENVDKPNLGFDFDVIVYEEHHEHKIVNWDDEKDFDNQKIDELTEDEMKSIELFIESSEPPLGTSLNNQHIDDIYRHEKGVVNDVVDKYGFDDFIECIYAGREQSNHPSRRDARLVMEFADACAQVTKNLCMEIEECSEDSLRPVEYYFEQYPTPYLKN